jgi:hypothetical protein
MFKQWLQSSTDPSTISNTVRGFVLSVSATLIFVGGYFGFPLTENQVAVLASQLGLAAGSLWTLYGLIIKVVVYFGKQ